MLDPQRLRATFADMPRIALESEKSKFSRYRESKRSQGLRQVRLWVPDLSDPAVRAEIRRQVRFINASPDNGPAMRFIEGVMSEVELAPYDWGDEGPPPFEPGMKTVK